MSFLVAISLPEFDGTFATVVNLLVPVGRYVGWNEPIAIVDADGVRKHIICNMPVAIDSWSVAIGEIVSPGVSIAMAEAEGDEIPYGKPFARMEQISAKA